MITCNSMKTRAIFFIFFYKKSFLFNIYIYIQLQACSWWLKSWLKPTYIRLSTQIYGHVRLGPILHINYICWAPKLITGREADKQKDKRNSTTMGLVKARAREVAFNGPRMYFKTKWASRRTPTHKDHPVQQSTYFLPQSDPN